MIAIALHGGAGDRIRATTTEEAVRVLKQSIEQAMDIGYDILRNHGSCIDAVEAAIRIMEDAPCFNAGIGAALNSKGQAELDAGIVDGATRKVGAVAGIKTIRHPIQAARYVMEQTPQVMYIGEDAERLVESAGLPMVENRFFITNEVQSRFDCDLRAQSAQDKHQEKVVLGTVGCVALDSHGHVCAANSTGGIMHKPAGRVGDTPINGAGMYADDAVGAIACTGHGEYFVRTVAAYDCAARMHYSGSTLSEAMRDVLSGISALGGRGGMIGLDNHGNISMQFSTTSMVRAGIDARGERVVEVW